MPTLAHKAWNNPMEGTSFVMQGLSTASFAFLSRTETTKVFHRLGANLGKELNGDAAGLFAANADIEKDTRIFFTCGLFHGDFGEFRKRSSVQARQASQSEEDEKPQNDFFDHPQALDKIRECFQRIGICRLW